MKYIKYIELGFRRDDLNDKVEWNNTGYNGFALTKNINDNMLISVSSGELDKPKLYIKKHQKEQYHIIQITPEIVIDMLVFINPIAKYTHAC